MNRRLLTIFATGILGVALAAGLALAADRITNQPVGLSDEPITAGEALAPPAPRASPAPKRRRSARARRRARAAARTPAQVTSTTPAPAPPTVLSPRSDDSGESGEDGRGRGRGRGGGEQEREDEPGDDD